MFVKNKMQYLSGYYKSIFVTLLICVLSFLNPSKFEQLPTFEILNFDKFIHFLMYGMLALVLNLDTFGIFGKFRKSIVLILCVIFPVVFGGLIELMQQICFYPRSADWADWLANNAGILVVNFLFYLFKYKQGQIHG